MLDIASTALDHNARHGITGYLYYDVTVFIQEIEGIRSDVEALYASIVRDDRHEGIRTIMTQDAETRVFGEWTMAFTMATMMGTFCGTISASAYPIA